jgi:hypothetical protein
MNESPPDTMQYSIHGTAHEYTSGHISTMPQLPVHESANSVHHGQLSHSHQSDEYNAALALLCLPISSRGTHRDATEQNHSIITPQGSFDFSRASTSLIPAQDPPNPPSTQKPANQELIPSAFYGSCSLALPQDEDNLSPLHCFVRKYGIEAFVVSEQDAQDKEFWSARNFKVKPGIVGMRCMYCGDRPLRERGPKSVHYPSSTKCIYYSMENWQRHHATNCKFIPKSILRDLKNLMNESKTGSGGRRCYWEDSAIMLGMLDTEDGIRFTSHPEVNAQIRPTSMDHTDVSDGTVSNVSGEHQSEKVIVVEEGDKHVISEYLFVLMSQMESCTFSEEDRSGSRSKVKDIKVGFPGMQCKHCNGKAGVGRYFPFSIQALSLANSDRNIHNHIKKCRRCPDTVKRGLERLRVNAQKSAQKIKRGSRKIFFSTVWARLHDADCSIDGSTSSVLDDAASMSDKKPGIERKVSRPRDRHSKGSTFVQEQPDSDPETKSLGPSDGIKETHNHNQYHRFEIPHSGRPQDPVYFEGDQSAKGHSAYIQVAHRIKETHNRNEHHRFEIPHSGRPQDPVYFEGDQSAKGHSAYIQVAHGIKETHNRNEHHRFEIPHPERPQDPAYFQGNQSAKGHSVYTQVAQATKFPVQVARNDPSYFADAEYSHNAIGSFHNESTYRPMPVLTAPEVNHYQMPHYPDQSLRERNSNSYQEYYHPHYGQAHFQREYSDPRRGNSMHRHSFPAMNIHEHQSPDARRYPSVQNSIRPSERRYDGMDSSNQSHRSCSPSGYTEL